ncbi:hypothetical protein BH10ACI1_BH10ACI1_29700 [soil metagenome]
MKYLILISLFFIITIFSQNSFACDCIWTGSETKEEIKNFYLKEFKGAIFTGKITEIKKESFSWDIGATYFKFTIKVDKYWMGVDKSKMIVHAAFSDCGVNEGTHKVGEKVFFAALYFKDLLFTSTCNYLVSEKEFIETFGKGKSFKKSK